jgi:acyl-CoA synthetase (AMP-forming)/AMP-acid ligase II
VGVADEDWGEIPVAYVTLKGQATAEDILATANAALGKTQRLKGLKILPEMPRSAIGKILKRELREQWQS